MDQQQSISLDLSAKRTYILDTSVLLSDPRAMLRFAEHDVVLPLVVLSELEEKRTHPELGYYARQSLRMLDDLRVQHGRLDMPVPITEDGGHLRVELPGPTRLNCLALSPQATTTRRFWQWPRALRKMALQWCWFPKMSPCA